MTAIGAVYCHIPFCHSICPFCAFAIHGNRTSLHGPYLEGLLHEITLWSESTDIKTAPLESLYIGGGTPSTFESEAIQSLLNHLKQHFGFRNSIEIAMELNPEDCQPGYLEALQKMGVNRISVGIQSLNNQTLSTLGRTHTREQGLTAIRNIHETGIENFNLDLLFGIPGVPRESLVDDVKAFAEAAPTHISLYGLDLEPGTIFGRDPGRLKWMGENRAEQTEQYLKGVEILIREGYRHYEISNFCKPGFEGRQNLMVWDGAWYLGFGMGAHSFYQNRRWQNKRHIRAYLADLKTGQMPVQERENLSNQQQANEALMLGLRRHEGLEIATWETQFGYAWDNRRQQHTEKLVLEGLARFGENRLTLTARGFMLADEITAVLMVE